GEITQLEKRSEETRGRVELVSTELRVAEQTLEEVSAQRLTAEREVYSAKHRHEQTQPELARLGLELTLCQSELSRIRQDVEKARLRAGRGQHQLSGGGSRRG